MNSSNLANDDFLKSTTMFCTEYHTSGSSVTFFCMWMWGFLFCFFGSFITEQNIQTQFLFYFSASAFVIFIDDLYSSFFMFPASKWFCF